MRFPPFLTNSPFLPPAKPVHVHMFTMALHIIWCKVPRSTSYIHTPHVYNGITYDTMMQSTLKYLKVFSAKPLSIHTPHVLHIWQPEINSCGIYRHRCTNLGGLHRILNGLWIRDADKWKTQENVGILPQKWILTPYVQRKNKHGGNFFPCKNGRWFRFFHWYFPFWIFHKMLWILWTKWEKFPFLYMVASPKDINLGSCRPKQARIFPKSLELVGAADAEPAT